MYVCILKFATSHINSLNAYIVEKHQQTVFYVLSL